MAAKQPVPGPSRLLDAGGKAYDWLKKGLGVYGTAVTLVQLLPAAIALAAALFSPTAWLSPTLRRWVLAGALTGTVVGMVILASRARPAELRELLAGKQLARAREFARLAWWGLGVALVAAVLLRLHLAVVDVGFVTSFGFLLPLFDFYLGGGPFASLLYNGVAGVLSAAVVAGLVAGGPAALLRWREKRAAVLALSGDGGPLSGFDEALAALEEAKLTLSAAKARLVELQVERDELAARLAKPTPPAERAQDQSSSGLTSEPGQPDRRAPRAVAGRPRR